VRDEQGMALKLIGAGFGRTGTLSVKVALEKLGFGPCYHMAEVMHYPEVVAKWAAIARGGEPDWDDIFEGYQSCVDWPACTYWRQIASHFPDAKVLLTVRDSAKWFASAQQTIFSKAHMDLFSAPDADPDLKAMIERLFVTTFNGRGHDREHAIKVFEQHNEEVIRSVPRYRLLCFNAAEGWEPLCRFLSLPVPDEPFPFLNSADQWLDGKPKDGTVPPSLVRAAPK
jgi:hypothetical protein